MKSPAYRAVTDDVDETRQLALGQAFHIWCRNYQELLVTTRRLHRLCCNISAALLEALFQSLGFGFHVKICGCEPVLQACRGSVADTWEAFLFCKPARACTCARRQGKCNFHDCFCVDFQRCRRIERGYFISKKSFGSFTSAGVPCVTFDCLTIHNSTRHEHCTSWGVSCRPSSDWAPSAMLTSIHSSSRSPSCSK